MGEAALAWALARAHGFVGALEGMRRRALALAMGALAAAALPPVHAVPLLLVAFPALLWLIDASPRPRAALAAGWWFGLGHFLAGLYWLVFAFLVEAQAYAWMAPFALAGLAAGLAVFPALAALAAGRAPPGAARVLVFAAAWTGLEWVRSWAFTGFAWNLTGSVWAFSAAMMQFAAIGGAYGLGLVTVAAAAAPALLAPRRGRGMRGAVLGLALAMAVIAGLWGGGALRLAGAGDDLVPGVRLRLVQGNVPQAEKWDPALRARHLRRYLGLSGRGGDAPPTHVIWPETAVPYLLANDPVRRAVIGRVAPEGGLVIAGAPRTTPDPPPPGSEAPFEVWNSLHAVDRAGRIVATYDKFHLVPFGEYVPLRGLLGLLGVSKLTYGRGDFRAGPGPVTLELAGLPPVSPLICYEIIFPGAVVAPAGPRPRWILNVTNDAWFGTSAGPYQHLAAARLRAVEEGLPVVRAANTGISAVIDAFGRARARLGLNRTGVIDSGLPVAAPRGTLYGRLGDWTLLVLLGVALGLAWLVRRPSVAGEDADRYRANIALSGH